MTIDRGLELAQRAREIGDGLLLESIAAMASGDEKKAQYISQEAIVLKKMTQAIVAITMAKIQNNEED